MKLGKKKVRRSMSTPAFGDFVSVASEWPAVKPRGWEYAVPPTKLEMLGNDQVGDCAEAGAMHFIQTETANSGNPLHGTLAQTLALYSKLTGYDPNATLNPDGSNPTDQGTDLLTLLQYWKGTGIEVTDSKGNTVIHKIDGYAALDTTSIAQMRYASDIFGGLYLGIQCPDSAMRDTSNWIWNPNSKPEGGHCVNGTGQGGDGGHVQSWGLNIPFTWEFALHTLDESYAIVTPFWINQQGKTPSGLNLDGLLSAFQKL
jgi:hypothetical protein